MLKPYINDNRSNHEITFKDIRKSSQYLSYNKFNLIVNNLQLCVENSFVDPFKTRTFLISKMMFVKSL